MKQILKSLIALLLVVLLLPIFSIQNIFAANEKDFEKTMKNSVVLYLNKPNILLHGKKGYISENKDVFPYKDGEKVLVPVDFFAKSFSGTAAVSGNSVTVTIGQKTSTFSAVKGKGNATYANLEEMCKSFDKYLNIDINGLIVYGNDNLDSVLDWSKNTKFMKELVLSFIYDEFTGSEMTTMVKNNYPDQAHPRLILTPEKVAELKAEINSPEPDAVYKKVFSKLRMQANAFLTSKPSKYEIRDGIRLLYVCQENRDRIIVCAMMYQLTGEDKYAECAWETMKTCAEFPDWNPYHFLDVGTLASALGLGYDWIYDWMDDSQRKLIRKALFEKAITPLMDDLDDKPRERSWNWRKDVFDNWCMIIAGECIAGLAICDELEGYELECTERAMEATLIDAGKALMLFAPYGAYEEGPGYWSYAMTHYTYCIKSVMSATGTDFGYVDIPGMRMTNDYMSLINGSVSRLTYHNGCNAGEPVFYPSQMMFLANVFENYEQGSLRAKYITDNFTQNFSADELVTDILTYRPEFLEAEFSSDELGAYLPISEVASFRTGYGKTDTYVGFHCDDPKSGDSHDHMDAGSFVLDSQGFNFFLDLGADNYNISNYLGCYRFRAEGHNTVVFNPDDDYDMKWGGTAKIVEYNSDEKGGYAIGDMTKAYNDDDNVKSFLRGIKLDNSTHAVTLQDEIRINGTADVWWFAHTKAAVKLENNKTRAILTLGGKKLVAEIQNGDGATFSVMEAAPLPTSPVVSDQAVNTGIRKLAIHLPECSEIDLCITFVPYNTDSKGFDYEFTSLDLWDGVENSTSSPADTNSNTNAPSDTTPTDNKGCSSSIGTYGVATIAAVSCATASALTATNKKKKRKTK